MVNAETFVDADFFLLFTRQQKLYYDRKSAKGRNFNVVDGVVKNRIWCKRDAITVKDKQNILRKIYRQITFYIIQSLAG